MPYYKLKENYEIKLISSRESFYAELAKFDQYN